MYSWANVTLNMEWFQYYNHQFMASLIPFTVNPYQQEYWFVRPISKNKFSMGVRAWRQVTIAKVLVTITENSKSCQWSFLDQVRGAAPWSWSWSNCIYDPTQQVNYEDSWWQYDYFNKMYGTTQWYGKQYYYTYAWF